MRQFKGFRILVTLMVMFFFGTQTIAATPEMISRDPAALRAAEGLTAPSKILYQGEGPLSPELVDNYNKMQKQHMAIQTQNYIPLNMQPSEDSGYVMSVIADKSASTIFNSPEVRASALGRTATKVEKNLKQEVVIGGGKGSNEIQHKIDFQIQAFQTRAQMKYEGITNATLAYEARRSTTVFEIFENLPTKRHQQLVLSHEMRPDERVSQVSLRWNW